jgi:hypothetical protein
MALREQLLVFEKGGSEVFSGVVVVVQMDFDLAEARPAKLGQGVQVRRSVFLNGIEKRMPWRAPVTVTEISETAGIVSDPAAHTGPCYFCRSRCPTRFVVVRETEEHMSRLTGSSDSSSGEFEDVGYNATVEATIAEHQGEDHDACDDQPEPESRQITPDQFAVLLLLRNRNSNRPLDAFGKL